MKSEIATTQYVKERT
ncbi:hypothetical protein BC937DRAFT_95428, partial [Endogone sp. FLAS-F59071]